MRKKTLNKEIRRSITGSLGRFLSIFSLMVLGVFAFVGLKVSGPDMRATAEHFYRQQQLADLTVTSSLGLDQSDQKFLKQTSGLKKIEFGYFQDVVIKDTHTSLRLFSQPDTLSTYQLMSGKMPQDSGEIALDYRFKADYHLGETLHFAAEAQDESRILRKDNFKIVGFVKSSEYVDKNTFGPTTVGTGQLNGYAVVPKKAFQSKVYLMARLRYKNLAGLSIYDEKYNQRLEQHQKQLESRLKQQGKSRLSELREKSQIELDEARQELAQQETNLTHQENQLTEQKLQLEQAQARGVVMSATQTAQLQAAQKQLQEGKDTLKKGQEKLKNQQEKIDALSVPKYTVNSRKEGNPGYQSFIDDSTRIDTLSNIFPVVLFAIALLVSLTTMTRFVEEERSNLGLLKALGYKNAEIRKKFLIYGLVSSGAGALVGTILGHTFLPLAVFNAYTSSSTFSNLRLSFSLFWTIVAFLIAIACSVLPAYWVVAQELKEVPARLFLAKVPKAGSRIFLEHITFIWERMSFTYKVTARNLFRYKKRMLMTIFGVAGCTALLVMGFGIRDSISGLSTRQFDQILHYDMIAIKQDSTKKAAQKSLDKQLNSTDIQEKLPIAFENLTKKTGAANEVQTLNVVATSDETAFSRFVTLRERKSQDKLQLQNQGSVISEKLAEVLKVKVGDTFTAEDEDKKLHKIRVAGITEMYMGHYIFMNQTQYQQTFGRTFQSNAYLITLKNPSAKRIKDQSAAFMKLPAVKAVSQNSDLKTTINSFMHGINSVMFVLITCAILLAIVVIYNLTNINVSERIRELSTVKVLGFYDSEVTLYIYRETILLSFLGIGAGFGLGAFFHHFIISQLAPNQIMFAPGLYWTNLVISAAITFATTLALALVVHFKLRKVDMLGALKSVD
ncbi:ABC transporter permease [Lactococcus taiwanensis]|uniref:ABC transporter permease n=1 Tax=Lactococcus taiwanensis TaxID=1151742 RepID=UPI003514280B